LTLTAAVADAISGATAAGFIPTGQVFFRDTFNGRTSTLGSPSGITLNAQGQAILTLPTTSQLVGTHSIIAIYTGSPNYAGKSSASFVVTVKAAATASAAPPATAVVVVKSSQAASVDGALVLPNQQLASVNALGRGNQPAPTAAPLTTSPPATGVDAYFESISRNGHRVDMSQIAHKLLVRQDDSLTGVW
jgi:hypothetical protein